jgi:hypothetical protein
MNRTRTLLLQSTRDVSAKRQGAAPERPQLAANAPLEARPARWCPAWEAPERAR